MESWLKYWWINWCFIMQDFVKPWRQPDLGSCRASTDWAWSLSGRPRLLKAPFNSGSVRAENWALPCGAIDARVPLFFLIKLLHGWSTVWLSMTIYENIWKWLWLSMTMTYYDYLIHLIGDDSMAKKYGTMINAIVKTKTYRSLPMRVFPAWISNTHSYQTLSELILLCSCTTANCSQNSWNPHL